MSHAGYTVCLFSHSDQGNHALNDLLEAGVVPDAIRVIGDIGPAAAKPGAQRHVTLDALHLVAADRTLIMDQIRDGGVVLATDAGVVEAAFAVEVGQKYHMLRVFHTTPSDANPSHNAAL